MNDNGGDGPKPRKDTRFKKGISGNPRGRPRKKKAAVVTLPYDEKTKSLLRAEAARAFALPDGSQMTIAQAAVRQLGNAAAKGKSWALRLYLDLHLAFERDDKKAYEAFAQTAIEYKHYCTEELDRRKRLGVSLPDPIPHPDDIIIDPRTFEVRIDGPVTPEEKEKWDRIWAHLQEREEEIRELEKDILQEQDDAVLEFLKNDLEFEKRLLAQIPEKYKNWPSAKKRSSG